MKHLNFNNIAYFLLIVLVVFCLYKLEITKRNQRNFNAELQSTYARSKLNEEVYKKIIGGMIVGEGKRINTEMFVSLGHNIDTAKADRVLRKNRIIVYYNEINCMVCVEDVLKYLEEKSKTEEMFNYQIVARYENLRDAIAFKKANKISREILKPLTKGGEKTVFMDDAFVAVIDENYKLHHLFFIDTESKEKIAFYFESLKYSKYLY